MSATDPDARRVDAISGWFAAAGKLVDARIDDARSHAWNALTRRVVAAPDGRRTLRAAASTRSLQAAVARLAELVDALAGPTTASLSGLVRDARAAFYRDAFDAWAVPPEIASGAKPSRTGENVARGLVVHGRDLRTEIASVVSAAESGLRASIVVAGERGMSDAQSSAVLDGWAMQKTNAVKQAVYGSLSDSYVAILNLVGREMVDPKYHAED